MSDKSPKLEVPEQMRAFAETSVTQAKKAFDDYIAATQEAVSRVEKSSSDVQSGASDVNRAVLSFAEENVSAAFDLAGKLVQAKDVSEMMALQQEFLKHQMAVFGEQARVISDKTVKTASEAAKAVKPDS
ncbi:MAG: phasin family protein [Pseudomonadota bacterium]